MTNLTSKDLRIGNLIEAELQYRDRVVNTDNKVTGYVTSINHFENGSYIGLEITGQTFKHHTSSIAHCSGVPLTPSILEAAGFKKSKAWVGVWSFVDKKNDVLFTIMEDSEGKFCHIQTNKSIKIEYVNDLQNVFYCLNNKIELTINLNQLQKA